jgi:hypothetical protein
MAAKKICKPIFHGWFINSTDGTLEVVKVRSNNLSNARILAINKFENLFKFESSDFYLSNVVQATLG